MRKVFNKDQRAFYKAHAPEGLELDDLSVLGPIFVVKVRFVPPELAHKLVAELWLYPDGGRIFELSTKCAPPELMDVYTSVRHYLIERGIDRHGEQQTKTKRALEFFAKGQQAPTAAGSPAGKRVIADHGQVGERKMRRMARPNALESMDHEGSPLSEFDVAVEARAELGEGPRWDAASGTLLWVDIPGHRVHRYDPATGRDIGGARPRTS